MFRINAFWNSRDVCEYNPFICYMFLGPPLCSLLYLIPVELLLSLPPVPCTVSSGVRRLFSGNQLKHLVGQSACNHVLHARNERMRPLSFVLHSTSHSVRFTYPFSIFFLLLGSCKSENPLNSHLVVTCKNHENIFIFILYIFHNFTDFFYWK